MPSHVAPREGVLGLFVSARLLTVCAWSGTPANRKRHCPRIGRHFLCILDKTGCLSRSSRLHCHRRTSSAIVSKILGSLAELLPHSWRKHNDLAHWFPHQGPLGKSSCQQQKPSPGGLQPSRRGDSGEQW